MRALILGEAERAAIAALIARAAAAPTPLARVRALFAKREKGDFLNPDNAPLTIDIPEGFRCTFTHEEQPSALCRHLSVSIDDVSRGPNPAAIALLMEEFGFINKFQRGAAMWLDVAAGKPMIVNVVEPLDGDMAKLRKEKS